MITKSLPTNFLRVLTLVGDSTIRRDFFPPPRVDLVLVLAFNFFLVFGSSLNLGLTDVLATTSPNTLSLLKNMMPCPAIELKYPHYPLERYLFKNSDYFYRGMDRTSRKE
jgi:hypothetical protein